MSREGGSRRESLIERRRGWEDGRRMEGRVVRGYRGVREGCVRGILMNGNGLGKWYWCGGLL